MTMLIIYGMIALLMINVVTLILLVLHMVRLRRLNENFNKVVNNIQEYLNCVLTQQEQEEKEEEKKEKEELLGQVLNEIFS